VTFVAHPVTKSQISCVDIFFDFVKVPI